MNHWTLPTQLLQDVMYQALERAVSQSPADVLNALERCAGQEQEGSLAQLSLKTTRNNLLEAAQEGSFACPDTGFPLFYVRAPDSVELEEGYSSLWRVCEQVVSKASCENRLRKTMTHPLTRRNPGTNVIQFMPHVELKFDPGIDYLELTSVPKGGGSEIFGTFYRMITPVDGLAGIRKFVLDSASRAMSMGKAYPPGIVGVAVGGTADLCMKLAKQAATLRPIGDRHPEPAVADLEAEFLEDMNGLGIGPMGLGGACTVLDVHVEYAGTHTAALPVALNAQCSVCRRATARIHRDGAVVWRDYPDWFGRGDHD